jgi:small subunit ribosomal protein S24e
LDLSSRVACFDCFLQVHERDIDTDLLLVVLKRLIEEKRAKKQPLKVLLMSATIDPTLFRNYFPDAQGKPASVVEVPGRSFTVQKHFLDDFIQPLIEDRQNRWAFMDESVARYVIHEVPKAKDLLPSSEALHKALAKEAKRGPHDEELEIPYPLVALTIAHVLQSSEDGHVLVFLPGWDEIQKVQKILEEPSRRCGVNFNDRSRYSIHVLHSSIPLAEQQVIFDPPPKGVRRIILSTNIAETSVTIPDVVYVVDTAKIKENRYDPERHISALVSAWVGTSNLNQRAGRAGRHRSGEYYGILGRGRKLHSHQEVEMKRMDLSNVVMHVKALDFPGMDVEDVLARTIEPPAPERVAAAMTNLKMVGALDDNQNLTSLGKILLKLPIDVQLGRLVLYGSFFKCLDQALTLAAILSNRDPFLCPPAMREAARDMKNSWCTSEFRSDIFAALNAFNKWYEFEKRGEYRDGSRFCGDNFLSKTTLLLIAKVKDSLFESLVQSGVVDISAGGVGLPCFAIYLSGNTSYTGIRRTARPRPSCLSSTLCLPNANYHRVRGNPPV